MLVERNYRFYAAHRNPGLNDKCSRLHGHRYGVQVIMDLPYGASGVTMKFEDIDGLLKPIFDDYDHWTLLEHSDPVAVALGTEHCITFPFPVSAENLAAHLLHRCRFRLPYCVALRLQETDSAIVHVTLADLEEYPKP